MEEKRRYTKSGDAGNRRRNQQFGNKRKFHTKQQNKKDKIGGSSIDISKLKKIAKPAKIEEYTPTHVFSDFDISSKLKTNVSNKGYIVPTPIQDKAIPEILLRKDVVGLANTGTGKTAAFLIPLIDKVLKNIKEEKVLIVAPTRELAVQIRQELFAFTDMLRIFSVTCIGGAGIKYQIEGLKRRPQFVVGTPGRIKDLIERGALDISSFKSVVLDEADRMLDMGFVDDMEYLLSLMPSDRQTLLFSATMSKEIESIIHKFQTNPVQISVKTGDTSDNVHQDIVEVKNRSEKIETLHDLLNKNEYDKVIIFGKTKKGVEFLETELKDRGFKVASIHGDKTQFYRQRSLKLFKENQIQALIATDVAARGLDIPNVSHVINYDVPATYEDYTHRIGRTGRAGKVGHALTFVER